MFRLLRVTLSIAPLLATSALAQATPKGNANLFAYVAETAAPARQQGRVAAGGLSWSCTGSRCTTSGPAVPSVAGCSALARSVGAIRIFGRDGGAQLDAAQLAACNASASPARAVATPPVTGTRPAAGDALRSQPLRNQAGVRFTPPPPTDSATAAKIAIVRELGVSLRPAAFGPSIWLTPQRPYVDATTNLQVLDYGTSLPRFESTADLPFGYMTIIGSPRSGGYPLVFHVAATPSRYHLFQCIVSGFTEYGYMSASLRERSSSVSNGRVNFVIEPALDPNRRFYLWGIGAESDHWTFGGCEITPFSP